MKYWRLILNYSYANPIYVQYRRFIRNIPNVKQIFRVYWHYIGNIPKHHYCLDISYIGSIFLAAIESKLTKYKYPYIEAKFHFQDCNIGKLFC